MNQTLTKFTQGHWSEKAALDTSRSHTPVVTFNGKIYAFGGGHVAFASLNSTMIYDPETNRWESGADMPTLRSGAVPAVINGKIYVMGGGFKQENGKFRFLKTVDIYEPETDSWSSGPDLLMPHDYPAVAYLGGYIYVLGGHHPDATEGGPSTDPGFDFCERWNPTDNTGWEQVASLPTPRFALSAVVVDGKIMTLGGVAFTPEGFNNFDHIESYDPATDQWSVEKELKLPWPAAGQGVCLLDNKLFVFGGYSGDGICDKAAFCDLSSREWHLLEPMPTTLAAMGLTTLDRTVYLIGGWPDDKRVPIGSVYAYTLD